jgi:hypothetical protein
VLRNWKEALQIGLLPIVLVIAVGILLLGGEFWSITAQGGPDVLDDDFGAAAGLGVSVALVWIFGMFIMLSVIVNWHRFVLLEQYPAGWVPPFHLGLALGYFGRILMLVLLAMLIVLPLGLLGAALDGRAGGAGAFSAIMILIAIVFLSIAFYRVAAILPAGAIGKPVSLRQAWEATQGATGTIVVLVLVLLIANLVLQLAVAALMLVFVPLGLLASVAAGVFWGLVSVSVLTTFYGHYI